jgi:hypothetical protein
MLHITRPNIAKDIREAALSPFACVRSCSITSVEWRGAFGATYSNRSATLQSEVEQLVIESKRVR